MTLPSDQDLTKRTADLPREDAANEKLDAMRAASLYDPDTVNRVSAGETPAEPADDSEASIQPNVPIGAPGKSGAVKSAAPMYAQGEKKRVVTGMTKDAIKRIADKAEKNAAKQKERARDA